MGETYISKKDTQYQSNQPFAYCEHLEAESPELKFFEKNFLNSFCQFKYDFEKERKIYRNESLIISFQYFFHEKKCDLHEGKIGSRCFVFFRKNYENALAKFPSSYFSYSGAQITIPTWRDHLALLEVADDLGQINIKEKNSDYAHITVGREKSLFHMAMNEKKKSQAVEVKIPVVSVDNVRLVRIEKDILQENASFCLYRNKIILTYKPLNDLSDAYIKKFGGGIYELCSGGYEGLSLPIIRYGNLLGK